MGETYRIAGSRITGVAASKHGSLLLSRDQDLPLGRLCGAGEKDVPTFFFAKGHANGPASGTVVP